jgi:hypothetical protein
LPRGKASGLALTGVPVALAAGVANEGWALIGESGCHHIGEFVFVGGCHEDGMGDRAEVGDVEEAVVGGAVVG